MGNTFCRFRVSDSGVCEGGVALATLDRMDSCCGPPELERNRVDDTEQHRSEVDGAIAIVVFDNSDHLTTECLADIHQLSVKVDLTVEANPTQAIIGRIYG